MQVEPGGLQAPCQVLRLGRGGAQHLKLEDWDADDLVAQLVEHAPPKTTDYKQLVRRLRYENRPQTDRIEANIEGMLELTTVRGSR